MTAQDVATYLGMLFGAWALGYGSGLVVYAVKRAADYI